MKIEILFSYNEKYGQRYGWPEDKSHCDKSDLYLFHKHKSTQLNKASVYKRFEFILNECIY